ncbi:MAG: molybdopterin-synthase adenylyltransferase MoeB [endosymbiont of Seepiophila jonesi]|uniref:Molybdopterin-synthase adenylyltransferase n=1 Tax=endosymbiont of Lamellibrachia luymesi TaxID=2200907 RepID=A0A370DAC3_9GAMM|nr:MAG: molybdopterin-synthase adenylyltransferase MoeB [endosymbiont of Lamellibrachia luymesi]RDH92108.1 MAG: molybdopterin-synthase adenylyltransferase MoeB [endosymbiont of Seepiophila jonesi]
MNDEQLLRYSRQIMLPSIGIEGQQRLLDASVLLIGLGGLGAPVAMYLAAAGVGRLTLVDFDQVDLSNLQRQIIHTTDRIGTPKVESAKQALAALNPEIEIECIGHQLEGDELSAQVRRADLVVDACDNFATRFAINAACHENSTPLVSGAAIRMEGQVSVFPGKPGSPCYRCLYPESGQAEDTCTANGVLAPVVGIIGSIQATEAIKCLTGAGSTLEGQLLILDALHMQWRSLKLKADPHCPVCGTG